MGLEQEFGITVEEDNAQSIATVQGAADLIEQLCSEKSAWKLGPKLEIHLPMLMPPTSLLSLEHLTILLRTQFYLFVQSRKTHKVVEIFSSIMDLSFCVPS
ncbi:Uncharacterized protein TCM_025964 [Theobroma cacao]|uniref:Carrier domain-containing protein n=1 Tax=Theobroma cacao TaxID=3641 RepID=A0A061F1B2_THECC|nr:Uncharacterized protein TCM_025964 [Theobroma cacao]